MIDTQTKGKNGEQFHFQRSYTETLRHLSCQHPPLPPLGNTKRIYILSKRHLTLHTQERKRGQTKHHTKGRARRQHVHLRLPLASLTRIIDAVPNSGFRAALFPLEPPLRSTASHPGPEIEQQTGIFAASSPKGRAEVHPCKLSFPGFLFCDFLGWGNDRGRGKEIDK